MATGKDFAHNEAPSQTETSAGITSILPVVGILFIAAACFSAGYWLGAGDIKQTGNKVDVDAMQAQLAVKQAESTFQLAQIETLEKLVKQWKNKAEQGTHTKVGELSFYKDLPKQSVTPAPISAKVPKKSAPKIAPIHVVEPLNPEPVVPALKKASGGASYQIQIASFRHQADAMPVQEKMLKAGFQAFIRQVDLGEKGHWFRVYAGPFASKSAAQEGMKQIEQKIKIKGFLVRAR